MHGRAESTCRSAISGRPFETQQADNLTLSRPFKSLCRSNLPASSTLSETKSSRRCLKQAYKVRQDLVYYTPNSKSLERAWSRGIVDRTKEYSFVLSTMPRLHVRSRLLELGVFKMVVIFTSAAYSLLQSFLSTQHRFHDILF